MIKMISIKDLKVGMFLQGLSRDAQGEDKDNFMNNIRVNKENEVDSYFDKGYRYAYVYFRSESEIPDSLKDAPNVSEYLEEITEESAGVEEITEEITEEIPEEIVEVVEEVAPESAEVEEIAEEIPEEIVEVVEEVAPESAEVEESPEEIVEVVEEVAPESAEVEEIVEEIPEEIVEVVEEVVPETIGVEEITEGISEEVVVAAKLEVVEEVERVDAWELPIVKELPLDEALTSAIPDKEDKEVAEIVDTVAYDEEVEKAHTIQQDAEDVAEDLLTQARSGKGLDADKAREVVENMIDSVFNNQDALVSLSRLKDYDNYTFMHSVNVSILTIALGRRIGLSREDLGILGMGGILHDVGKMLVPDEILNKAGTLTKKEFKEMKNHVTYGVELLEKSRGIADESIYVTLQHHERIDGSGYPNETPGEELHLFGRIGSICDVYDAITTIRAYGDTPPPNEALKKMYGWKGQNFDPDLMDHFIMCLGIYPIGSVLELDTGEVCVVKAVNRTNLLKPKVLVYMDGEGKRYFRPFVVDFVDPTERSIVSALDQSIFPSDLEKFIEQ